MIKKPLQRVEGYKPISRTPDIDKAIAADAVVALGCSGGKGKDSQIGAHSVVRYLDEVGHAGPRILIHADLGRLEWRASREVCERLARNLGLELMVVQRTAGDLLHRWQQRWASNVARYANLSCVKLILPWSTPSMRFCASELKVDVICRSLTARFPGKTIVSASGIRRDESKSKTTGRAIAPISAVQPKLSARGCNGYNWHPIIEWTLDEVLSYGRSVGEVLHPAYTEYGASRVSCAFCIMSAIADLKAAATCPDNAALYRELVALEVETTYAFQGSRWLADVAPDLLDTNTRAQVALAKERATRRVVAESRLPEGLLYSKGWPARLPTTAEAALIAQVRREVADAVGFAVRYTDTNSVIARFAELLAERQEAA